MVQFDHLPPPFYTVAYTHAVTYYFEKCAYSITSVCNHHNYMYIATLLHCKNVFKERFKGNYGIQSENTVSCTTKLLIY